MNFRSVARFLVPAMLLTLAGLAQAQVTVSDPWVRATVAQQKTTGAFMQLQSAKAVKLVSVSSPVAGVAEVHEMSMDGTVMRMRAVPALDVPAGKAVALKPGSYHVMLMDLKAPVKDGDQVPLTLVFEGADKQRETVQVSATARALTPKAASHEDHKGHDGHKH